MLFFKTLFQYTHSWDKVTLEVWYRYVKQSNLLTLTLTLILGQSIQIHLLLMFSAVTLLNEELMKNLEI